MIRSPMSCVAFIEVSLLYVVKSRPWLPACTVLMLSCNGFQIWFGWLPCACACGCSVEFAFLVCYAPVINQFYPKCRSFVCTHRKQDRSANLTNTERASLQPRKQAPNQEASQETLSQRSPRLPERQVADGVSTEDHPAAG